MTNLRAIVYACPDKGLFSEGSKVSWISSYRQTLFIKKTIKTEAFIIWTSNCLRTDGLRKTA